MKQSKMIMSHFSEDHFSNNCFLDVMVNTKVKLGFYSRRKGWRNSIGFGEVGHNLVKEIKTAHTTSGIL